MNTDPNYLKARFEEFLAEKKAYGRSDQTINSYRDSINNYLLDGNTYFDNEVVKKYLVRYPNPATRNRVLATFRSYCKWAGASEQGITVGRLTLEDVPIPKALPITVDDTDAARFFMALDTLNTYAYAHAVLMQETGLRFGEVLALRPANLVDMAKDGFFIQFYGKGNKERIVPLTKRALRAFHTWTEQVSYMPESTVRWWFRKALVEAGVSALKPHWFRHTIGTKMTNAGNSYDLIADILGNTVEVCRANYSRTSSRRLREAVLSVEN